IDFAAAGGTNFSKLELMRSKNKMSKDNTSLSHVGHTAQEMLGFLKDIHSLTPEIIKTDAVIISGGIQGFLQAYDLISRCPMPAIYGQASALLKRAMESYEVLEHYLQNQMRNYRMAEKL